MLAWCCIALHTLKCYPRSTLFVNAIQRTSVIDSDSQRWAGAAPDILKLHKIGGLMGVLPCG
jgi:hypothetical protein